MVTQGREKAGSLRGEPPRLGGVRARPPQLLSLFPMPARVCGKPQLRNLPPGGSMSHLSTARPTPRTHAHSHSHGRAPSSRGHLRIHVRVSGKQARDDKGVGKSALKTIIFMTAS